MKKKDLLKAIEEAIIEYEKKGNKYEKTWRTQQAEYYHGVASGLNKAYQFIAENGDYDLLA